MCLIAAYSAPSRAQDAPQAPAAAAANAAGSRKAARAKAQQDVPEEPQNRLGITLLKHLALDQKAIWTSPSRVRFQDATWLVPLGGATAGLMATDTAASRHLSNNRNRLNRSRQISNDGLAALVGASGGLYLWGRAREDEHKRETGLLAGEAVLNALAFNSAVQLAAGRERPLGDNGKGRFRHGGSSFPSSHAAAAWAIAGVIVHEYPGPLTRMLAYGAASAISAARVTGKEHFPSDALVGSAVGWFIGRQVYRRHHNYELGGSSWETIPGSRDTESAHEPRNMGSPYVPLDSWIYPAIERLAGLGYAPSAFLSLRPWTRLECARILDEAEELLQDEDTNPPEAERVYGALTKEFAPDLALLGGGLNRRVQLESVYSRVMGISGPPLRDSYHFGQTIVNDYGRPYEEGTNVASGFSAWATDGPFVVYIRSEFEHTPSAPALPLATRQTIAKVDFLPGVPPATPIAGVNQYHLLDCYVAMSAENWEISFGKQSLWWGPGKGGPMLFSDNADPINMFRISRVTPFTLPWFLRWLGPLRVEFFLGQVDGHHFVNGPSGVTGSYARPLNPQPFVHGQKLSFKPTRNFEFSVSRTTVFAGSGVALTAHKFVQSMFSLATGPPGSRSNPGDRRSALDFSYRIPKLRNWLTFYADTFTDDQFSPIAYMDRSAASAGVYLTHFPGVPKLDFRLEGVYTDLPIGGAVSHGFFYFNPRYLNGYTNEGNLLGSWIGRQGQGAQAWTTYWLSPKSTIQASYRHQKVSKQFIPFGGTLTDVAVRADLWLRHELSLSGFLQYEQWKFPVIATGQKSNLATSFQLTFWPRSRPSKKVDADDNGG
jgi:membrane-associated phospholipid phosphatase